MFRVKIRGRSWVMGERLREDKPFKVQDLLIAMS